MMIVGLTGSIGMGKSTAARMLRQMGVPVYDADANVHALQAPGGAALPEIEAAFPGVVKSGVLDRQALGARVFGNKEALRRLEAIVHPLVRAAQGRFLRRACRAGADLVVLDVPLLFETGGDRRVDAVAVVWASPLLQAQRALRRPGMTAAKLASIRAQQLPDRLKLRRADYVIPSGFDGGVLAAHVAAVIAAARRRPPRAWPPGQA